jgi:hypothetical protein
MKIKITKQQTLKAIRKAEREIDIMLGVKRNYNRVHKSKKTYNRKQNKKIGYDSKEENC